jgi:hypothetical protein
MFPLKLSPKSSKGRLLPGLLVAIAPVLIAVLIPVLPLRSEAHEVEVSGAVGGTMHIEPNDAARAGTASLAWFALNRRGGLPIPLADCNCTLAVYAMPHDQKAAPIQQPALSAISIEGRSGVPSATITFPRAGTYELVLKGQPNAANAFSPFELRFAVTVAQ